MSTSRKTSPTRTSTTLPPLGDWEVVAHPDIPVPRIARRRSKVHGWGVFALEDITKNRRIVAYTGQKITWEQAINSTHDLAPDNLAWGDEFKPDDMALPGQTKFI